MERYGGKDGFILPTVLFVIGLAVFIAVAMVVAQRSDLLSTDSQSTGTRAAYLAESGAQDAIRKLVTDATYRTNTNVPASGPYSYTTAAADVSGQYVVGCYNPDYSSSSDDGKRTITVSGQLKNSAGFVTVSRGLVVTITFTVSASQTNISDFAVYSLGSVTLSGSAAITGNTGVASGNVILSGSTRITGNVAANGITCPSWCTITGTQVTGYSDSNYAAMAPGVSSTVSGLNRSTYSSCSLPAGISYSSGSYRYSAPRSIGAGNYYVPDKFTLDGVGVLTSSGAVTIYCTGNVQIGNSGGLSGDFLIISEGAINVDGAAYANKALLISAGAMTLGGSGSLAGGALSFGATGTTISGAGFTYNETAYTPFSDVVSEINVTYTGWGSSSGTASVNVESYDYN